MIKNKLTRKYPLIIIITVIMFPVIFGCAERKSRDFDRPLFTSFRDIPGVTGEEIAAILELQTRVDSFIYAANYSTEAFHKEGSPVEGFTALFCSWLSKLFGIPFIPRTVEWDELIDGLESKTFDFTGELTATDERRKKYFMTDDIIQRQMMYVRLNNSVPIMEIAEKRPLRYVFLDGTVTMDDIRKHRSYEFETFFVDDYSQAYQMLADGKADAFFDESSAEAAFDEFGEVSINTFFPIIYSPVSLTTQNPEFKPIIDVVQKALENGAIHHLTRLYNQGQRDYLRHKLFMVLTQEEREYIRDNPVIPFIAEAENYPLSFFDPRTKQWEGIAIDVISEIERLTGLKFERKNDENTIWDIEFEMLKSGAAAMITELIPLEERVGDFLWPEVIFFRDHFALISKMEHHDINVNEILYLKTGVARNTAYSTFFKRWFPNHRNIYEFDDVNFAFDALDRGEIDMVIASENQLLIMTNYRELVGYKANFVFPYYFNSTFGFNKDEVVLASIFTKAMRLIDVDGISGRWLRRNYDYRIKLAKQRIPYMVGGGMLFIGLIFSVILFVRKRKEGLVLETLVENRTKELMENQLKLMEAVETAQEASRTKTAFLANMSHEIRTPMNAIIGMAEILEHEKLNDYQKSHVEDIRVSARSLLGIINDILDMSKIEAGKLELNPADYSLSQFIDNIVSMFTHVAKNKGLEFLVDTADNLPGYLYGDDLRLRQTLTNICGNAVKFTKNGHVKLSVSTKADTLVFKIEDTGMGIRREDLPKLFDAFQQVDSANNRNVVGTGLGLSICKSFVEMMGGEITVESEYGHGTAFTVSIPIVKGNSENISSGENMKVEENLSAPSARILITDDNEFNLKVASGLLGLMDIKAEIANSGFKAVELVKQNDYDIVFMDHMMPEMDGIETTQKIRKLGSKYEMMTIIALTANAVKGAREMFAQNGFNDFISKPIDVNELRRIVKKHLAPQKIQTAVKPDESQTACSDAEVRDNFLEKLQKIGDINIEIGLSRVSNMESMYHDALELFYKKLNGELDKLAASLEDRNLANFAITVHAMKSALSTIGAMGLSELAAKLEDASKENKYEYCNDNFHPFEERMAAMHEQLSEVFVSDKPAGERVKGDESMLNEAVEKALAAADDFDSDQSAAIIKELVKYDFGDKRNALLENALEALGDFNCG
ncbi:MAG: ATP-binding protein, partial [Chitinispirillia bacterium]|nr:ATP-binding protein [Chitinispirillia bacterium]